MEDFDNDYFLNDFPNEKAIINKVLEGGEKLEDENNKLLNLIKENDLLKEKLQEKNNKIGDLLNEIKKGRKPTKTRSLEDYNIVNNSRFAKTNDKILKEEHKHLYKYQEGITAFDKISKGKQETLNYNTEKYVPLKLMKYQNDIIKNWTISASEIIILYFGVGSGKTMIAVNLAEQFQDIINDSYVYFLLPASLILNTIKEFYKVGIDPLRMNSKGEYIYYFISYQQMLRSNFDFKNNALLIIDEAHNLRNLYAMDISEKVSARKYVDTGNYNLVGSKLAERLLNTESKFMRTVMMTGTLFVNSPFDIEGLISIGYKKRPLLMYDEELYNHIISDNEKFKEYYQGIVSFYRTERNDPRFPSTNYEFIPVFSSDIPPHNDKFYLQGRNLYNKAKLKKTIQLLEEYKNKRILIYTQFIERSSDPLLKALDKLKIKYSYVSGELSMQEKKIQVDNYNEGKTNIMIFTLSIKEGISFVETDLFIFLQPYWNYAITEQVIARAIRLTSHREGSKSKVDIKFLVGANDSLKYNDNFDKLLNLYDYIMNNDIKKLKYDDELINKFDPILFSKVEENLRIRERARTGRRDKKQDAMNQNFVKIDKRYLNKDFGSTDCILFNKMFNKQEVINEFEQRLLKLPSFEKVNNNENNDFIRTFYAYIKKLENDEKRQLSLKEETQIKKEMYKEYYNKSINKLNFIRISDDANFKSNRNPNLEEKMDIRDYGNIENNISELIKNNYNFSEILEYFGVDKQEIVQFQANFTPKNYCDLIIKKSGIENDTRQNINVLEPTAGIGNIIQSLLQVKNKENLLIDCNEYHKLFYNIGKVMFKDIDNVKWTNFNFYDYVNRWQYEYILGNPPFNVPMVIKGQDIRWYDVNFISKMFDMLAINGKLCCIISNRFTRDKRFPFNKFKEYLNLFNEKSPGSVEYQDIGEFKKDKNISKEMETSFGMVLLTITKTEAINNFTIDLRKNITIEQMNQKTLGNTLKKFTKKQLLNSSKDELIDILNTLVIFEKGDENKSIEELANKIFEFQKHKQTTENNAMIIDKKEQLIEERKQEELKKEVVQEIKKHEPKEVVQETEKPFSIHDNFKKKRNPFEEKIKPGIGSGLFDTVSNFVKEKIIDPVKNKVENIFSIRKGFNNKAQRMLKKYGDMPINSAFIRRAPISKILDKVINIISLGKWKNLKEKFFFDDMFHLQIVFNIGDNKNVLIEKNEVINIDDNYKTSPNSQEIKLDLKDKNLTINRVLDDTLKKIGEESFFKYSAFKYNCQHFIKSIVQDGLNALTKDIDNFIYQDIGTLMKEMPSYVQKVANTTTDIAAVFNKLIGGKYENDENFKVHAIVFKKPFDLEEAKKISQDIIKDKNKHFYRETKQSYRFRNIPKTKFEYFRTKKVNKNMSIIFGKLKN